MAVITKRIKPNYGTIMEREKWPRMGRQPFDVPALGPLNVTVHHGYVWYVSVHCMTFAALMLNSVAEPKLRFVSAPAPTFKKFPLRLRLQLCGYLFLQLLNKKVDFS